MELIPTADVAHTLRCTTRTVARLVDRGELTPAARAPGLRGAYLFDPATVADYAKSRGKA